MRKGVRTALLVTVIVALVLSVGSCRFLGFINPGWALEGSWEIRQKPDAGWEAHTYFVFLPDAEGYQIQDANRSVFESGPILNLTDSNFDYEIDEHTIIPEIVGTENYAEYVLDRDDLSITFYADRQKSANFGTIQAIRE